MARPEIPFVTVILPTFNECGNIVPLIEEIQEALGQHTHEILVVDDNSSDGTADRVRETFEKDPRVRVYIRKQDPSLGRSILRGIMESAGENLLVMDSDFNHQPKYIPFMLQSLDHFDMVMGSRFLYGGLMQSRARLLLSWLFNVFVRVVTGGMITDNLYGFFAVKTSILEKHRESYREIFDGYGEYFIRLVYFMEKSQVAILQFPAVNGDRRAGQGNSAFLKTFWIYFTATLKFAANKRKQ